MKVPLPLLQLLVLFCCISSFYASTKLKLRTTSSQVSFIDPNKAYYIRGIYSGRYIDVMAGQMYDGSAVGIWDLYFGTNQQWQFVFSNGNYKIKSVKDSNYLLSCQLWSTCSIYGAGRNPSNFKQEWIIQEYTGPEKNPFNKGKMIVLQSIGADAYLEVAGGGTSNGGRATTWTKVTASFRPAQIWVLEEVNAPVASTSVPFIDQNKLYYLRGLRSNKYLDNFSQSTNVGIWQWYGGAIQQWKFDFSSGSYYQIRSAQNTNNLLTCDNMGLCTVTPPAGNSLKQRYKVAEYTGPLKNPYGGNAKMIVVESLDFPATYLEVNGGGTGNGGRAGLWSTGSAFGDNNIWLLEEVSPSVPSIPIGPTYVSYLRFDTGSRIRNLGSGKYLDWYSGQNKVGIWDGTGGKNQLWMIRADMANNAYRIVPFNDYNQAIQCGNMGSCVIASSGFTRFTLLDYTGPATDGGSGRKVVLRAWELGQYLSVGGTSNGIQTCLWSPNDGINGSKFSNDQIWVLEGY